MNSRSLLLVLSTTFLFNIFCGNTISSNDINSYTKKELIGTWFYGDTCFLFVYITYTFTDSICTEEVVYIGSEGGKRGSDNIIVFEDWFVQSDSLFLIYDTVNTNSPENEVHRFNFNDEGNLLLAFGESYVWLEFMKVDQLL